MAKKLLSVSLFDETFHYAEIVRQPSGLFCNAPQKALSVEALASAARKADEIYINAAFPAALYAREVFPRVAKRYIDSLVGRNAHERLDISDRIFVEHKIIGDVIEGGVAKRNIAYIALREEEVLALWQAFYSHHHKIKHITPVPVSLAACISQTERPEENFMVVCAGETETIVMISSSEGMVKVARNVPLSLSDLHQSENAGTLAGFSDAIDKEITMTTTFFKQEFREAVPRLLYVLGDSRLEQILTDNPLPTVKGEPRFILKELPVQGLSPREATDHIQLLSNLFTPEGFNFLPRKEIKTRRLLQGAQVAAAACFAAIICVGLWSLQLAGKKERLFGEYSRMLDRAKIMYQEVDGLRDDLARLQPLDGWNVFYENTVQLKPPWHMVLSECALLMPGNIVMDTLQITPLTGQKRPAWNCLMAGKIRADDWQKGLQLLRRFGGKIHASPFFEVRDIKYSPEQVQQKTKTFSFQVITSIVSGHWNREA